MFVEHVNFSRAAVGVVQRVHHDPHVRLDGTRPLFQVPQALQALMEALHQRQPLRRLFHVARRMRLQRLRLAVQPPLILVRPLHAAIERVHHSVRAVTDRQYSGFPPPFLLLPQDGLSFLMLPHHSGEHGCWIAQPDS